VPSNALATSCVAEPSSTFQSESNLCVSAQHAHPLMSDALPNQFEEPFIEIGNAHVLLKPHQGGHDCLAVFAQSIRASMVLSFIRRRAWPLA